MSKNSTGENVVDPLQNHPVFGAGKSTADPDPTATGHGEPLDYSPEAGDYDEGYGDVLAEADDDYDERITTRRSSRSRRRVDAEPSNTTGRNLIFTGLAMALAGMALGVVLTSKPDTLGNLAKFLTTGVTPGTIVVAGFALLAAGLTIRASQPDTSGTERLEEALVRVEDSVEQLASTTPAIEGDELHRTLHLLQRQDEKINNLTRAFKMYGKPLVELGNASSDTLGGLRELQTGMKTVHATVKDTVKELEGNFSELERQLSEVAVRVSEVHARQGKDEIVRLLEGQKESRSAQDALLAQLDQGITQISAQVDATAQQVAERLAATPTGPDYEDSFRGLQRELQGLATTLGNIQANMGRGMASAPSSAGPAAPPAPSLPESATGSGSLKDGPPSGAKKPPAGLANSIAGTQKAKGGKNVLGAIAKLKQMRN